MWRKESHIRICHPLYIKANPEYVGRKVRVLKPDWIRCDDEFILEEWTAEFLIDIVGIDLEARIGHIRFYLDGSDELVDEARVCVRDYERTTTLPDFKFNGKRLGYCGSGYLELGAEGGILECIGGTYFPDELSVTCDMDWLEPIENSPSSRVAGAEYNFRFRVKPNPSNSKRYGKLVFTGADSFHRTVDICQRAGNGYNTTV